MNQYPPRHAVVRPAKHARRRAFALLFATLLSVLSFAAPAQAAGAGPTVISYQRTVDLTGASHQHRGSGGLLFRETLQPSVTANNLARATTACNGCVATAISFEIVVASGGPKAIEANNTALAVNVGCTRCSSTALAYQFVVANDRLMYLTLGGRAKLALIGAKAAALAQSGASPTTVEAKADAYADQVRSVLAEDLRTFPVFHRSFRHAERG